jgi:hypothetical protein
MASDNITSMPEVATSPPAAEPGLQRGYADMTALCRGNLGAAMAASQAAICGAQEIAATLLAFLQSRAKDSLAAGQQLAACRSPEAVVEVQLECAKATLHAYTDEFGRLHALTGRILADVLVPGRRPPVHVAAARAATGAEQLAA